MLVLDIPFWCLIYLYEAVRQHIRKDETQHAYERLSWML